MFGLGIGEIIVIFILAIVLIGPKKLPELAKTLGKSFQEFQKAKQNILDQVNQVSQINHSQQTPEQPLENRVEEKEKEKEEEKENKN